MNSIEVGLLGSVINNGNLGCQALTYSIIDLLEWISRDLEIQFHYNIFEWFPNSNLNLSFSKRIGIDPANLTSIKLGSYRDFLHKVRHYFDNHNMDIDEFRRIGLHYLKLGEQLGDYNCTKTIYNLLQRKQLPPQDWKPIQYYKEKADSLFLLAVNDRK